MADAGEGFNEAPATDSQQIDKDDLLAKATQSELDLPAELLLEWDACIEPAFEHDPVAQGGWPQQSPPPAFPPSLPPTLSKPEQSMPPPPAFAATFKPPVLASVPPSLSTQQRQAWLSTPQPPMVPPSLPPLSLRMAHPFSEPPSMPPSLPAELWHTDAPQDGKAPTTLSFMTGEMKLAATFDDVAKEADRESPTGSETPRQFPPGLKPPPGIPNHGSALHGTGTCRPCAWFWKFPGCQKGQECGHCHLCPDGEIKVRKKAKQATSTPLSGHGMTVPLRSAEQEATDALRAALKLEATAVSPGTCAALAELESTSASDQEPTAGSFSEQEILGASDYEESQSAPHAEPVPTGAASLGSLLHEAGCCSPCVWFWKPSGCSKGQGCGFCHLCPEGVTRVRRRPRRSQAAAPMTAPMLATPMPSLGPEFRARCGLGLIRPR
eukprot:CAMPEP_0179021882 /NCGR_PEP_ID=MMETSP0796-20121207/6120_1 /TAXON_ID=73915 /ORGANISM="Pyrodinium bahamense, Strain pbaha01" /LENGTH=437 /DNA_ID=CAMNT_0020717729 /DNA_START=5 /DNA_END=1319 /DNA_ORIENTATION=-